MPNAYSIVHPPTFQLKWQGPSAFERRDSEEAQCLETESVIGIKRHVFPVGLGPEPSQKRPKADHDLPELARAGLESGSTGPLVSAIEESLAPLSSFSPLEVPPPLTSTALSVITVDNSAQTDPSEQVVRTYHCLRSASCGTDGVYIITE